MSDTQRKKKNVFDTTNKEKVICRKKTDHPTIKGLGDTIRK